MSTLTERLVNRALNKKADLDEELVPFEASGARIMAVAKDWESKNPDLAKRMRRAVALTGGILQNAQNKRVFYVEGEGDIYRVTVDPSSRSSSCTCPDSSTRGAHCKHRLAVGLVYAARGNKLA